VQIDLIVKKQCESYISIVCEKHIAKELSEYFSFFVPGYQFTPQFKARIWNGKIYLFDFKTHRLYRGLLSYLKAFCERQKYVCFIEDDLESVDEVSKESFLSFVDTLKLPFAPRDYQIDAALHSIRNRRAVLLSPTASGKSLILYLIVRYLLAHKCEKGLLIVPTISLVEQMFSDFGEYAKNDEIEMNDLIHKIYQGKEKETSKQLTISTWQSIHTLPKEWFVNFDFVLGDEAHSFKAKSLSTIMTNLLNSKYRIGCTGTLDGTKTHKLMLEGLFGPVFHTVTTKQLIDKKQLSAFKIKCLILKHPPDVCKRLRDGNYQSEIEYIVSCNPRNQFIKNLTLGLKGNSLVLFQLVEKHGKELYKMIVDSSRDRKVFFVSGSTDVTVREDIRKITEKENDAIIVASFGTFSTGINIRNLHNIVFASPSKSRIRNLQSIGRGLRLGENKEVATLYDIADDFRIGKHINYTLQHFSERVKLYNEEKFEFKFYNIEMKK